jgi:hypothetical protein
VRVEECTVYDLDEWVSAGLFDYRSGRIDWVFPLSETTPPIAYMIRPTDVPACRYLYLRPLDGGEESKWKPITVLGKPQRLGGLRWYSFCPRVCRRWVRILYRPPSMMSLGCRLCHELTYQSTQEHGSRLALFRRNPLLLGAEFMAGSVYALSHVLSEGFPGQPRNTIIKITELPVDPATEGLMDWELREYVPPRSARECAKDLQL